MSLNNLANKIETITAKHLVCVLVKHKLRVRVHDGEMCTTDEPLSDFNEILLQMGSTDLEGLVVHTPNNIHVGTILLVYGNDEDLISDWSWVKNREHARDVMELLVDLTVASLTIHPDEIVVDSNLADQSKRIERMIDSIIAQGK